VLAFILSLQFNSYYCIIVFTFLQNKWCWEWKCVGDYLFYTFYEFCISSKWGVLL